MIVLRLKSIPVLMILCASLIVGNEALFAQKKKSSAKKEMKNKDDKEEKKDKNAIKPYEEVITKEAKTDAGVFDVHCVGAHYYLEVPDSLFHRDFLMVSRFMKTPEKMGWTYGGTKMGRRLLRFERRDKQLFLKNQSYDLFADRDLPIAKAVANSNYQTILHSFPIKAVHEENKTVVIQVDDFLKKDIKAFGMSGSFKKANKIGGLDANRSYIDTIRSYPKNLELRTVRTYNLSKERYVGGASQNAISMEISNSIILLPKKPMKRRYFDRRVGWFTSSQTDYGLAVQRTKSLTYLDRWRLEVKEEDIEKFKKGELVEPKKPIVYYIDPATPKKWIKYLKQGVDDWQKAFEKAGFKNAIYAKEAPTKAENPDWSPEDVRYSVIRYLASDVANAVGPHVSDPRSGEILEADIQWFHNVMSLLHNWFFIQTAAINPEARGNDFKEKIMGRLIRFVSSHEVGHTLGLPHNMGSSAAYPVDSLRSTRFTQKYGTAPSIMDYARFNYVAQPNDKGVALMPHIGVYDKYAINWGYRPILDAKTAFDEKPILDAWILAKADDPMCHFGKQQGFSPIDPSAQTEDLGDDAVKASFYGIQNLKRIVPKLEQWTYEEGEDYSELRTMYRQVLSQYSRYMGHVVANIGGVYEDYKSYGQEGAVYTTVPEAHQKKCLDFLFDQCFKTPYWLIDKNIYGKIAQTNTISYVSSIQKSVLAKLLEVNRMERIVADDHVDLIWFFDHLNKSIFTELYQKYPNDVYRRALQKKYIDLMIGLWRNAKNSDKTDLNAAIYGNLQTLYRDLKKGLRKADSKIAKYHFQDLYHRIGKFFRKD